MPERVIQVYHHYDNDAARINVKVERNSRGMNWEITVTTAKSVDEAIALIHEANLKLRKELGDPQ